VTDSAFLVVIEPVAVSFGGAAAQDDIVCAFGCTAAVSVMPLLAVVHSSR
jgi:hypothetical protein